MIELVLSICLVENPALCREENLQYVAESLTPLQCVMGAQPEIAKWAERHPRWQVKRWSCHAASIYAKA